MQVSLEWGPVGARVLGELCDALVVVDVLSFSTALTVAVGRGVQAWPHPGGDDALRLARELDAELAGQRSAGARPSLSPASLTDLDAGSRLVLPSPNGSAISSAAGDGLRHVVAGCLRNGRRPSPDICAVTLMSAWCRRGAVPRRVAAPGVRGSRRGRRDRRPVARAGCRRRAVAGRRGRGARVPLAATARALPLGHRAGRARLADDVRIASEVDASMVVPVLVDGRFIAS